MGDVTALIAAPLAGGLPGEVPMHGFDRLDELRLAGREAARSSLAAWSSARSAGPV